MNHTRILGGIGFWLSVGPACSLGKVLECARSTEQKMQAAEVYIGCDKDDIKVLAKRTPSFEAKLLEGEINEVIL